MRLRAWDVLVPASIYALGVVELLSVQPGGWHWALLLEGLACALLVLRRRFPLVSGIAATYVVLSMPWAGTELNDVSAPILVMAVSSYSFARWIAGYRGLLGIAAVLLVLASDYMFADDRMHDISDVVFALALLSPPYVFGRVVRRLADQSEQLRRQQELIRDQAVREERDRIARELHDVIAHSLSAMVVQTAAAQDLVRLDPARAVELLDNVADTGRRALAETGRLLHLIRDDGDELGLRPAPGLADLPALVADFRAHGLDVAADLDLPAVPLTGGIDVSAYRVVQEALTNALKYADGPVRLRVAARPDRLVISCANRVGRAHAPGSGLGLQGMAERVSLLGGTLRTGDNPETGFVLDVDIPLAVEGAR